MRCISRRLAGALAAAAVVVPFLLATSFLGLALSVLFTRREHAIQALLFTSLPAVFLAGWSWPPEALPRWLRLASQLVPTTRTRVDKVGEGSVWELAIVSGFRQARGASVASAYGRQQLLSHSRI